jgi:very-short-patch-repair endonuclease
MRKELDLHVAVPRTAQVVPTGRGIKGHIFDIRDGDTATWRSLALSSAERVFCELASRLTVVDLVAAGDFLIHHQQPLTTTVRLSAAVGLFRGRRGLRTMRAALPLLDERSESPQESKLRVILLRGGVSTIANFPIRTSGGFSYRVDLAIPELRVVIEYQSDEFHSDPIARRRDMTRRARLEADGWFVMELNADDLANPSELIERLRRVIESRQRGY